MREIRQILDRAARFRADEKAALATVIDVQGSGYRLPGARMLIMPDGEAFGTVSGGCLEADVLERAKIVLATGRAEVFTYDTTADEDSVFGLNMGCRGVMRILIEIVRRGDGILRRLDSVYKTRMPVATAVITDKGDTHLAVGTRIYLTGPDEQGIEDPHKLLPAIASLHDDLLTFYGTSSIFEINDYEAAGGGFVEAAFEMLWPPVQLLIVGAGADAVPLAEIAYTLGWQTCIYDHRPAYLKRERFPTADELVELNADGPSSEISADDRTAVVLMTHNYGRDRAILPMLLRLDAFYIGALGPMARTQQMLGELAGEGVRFSITEAARLYAPAGLDIGGDTPEAIAAAIIAEVQSVLARRDGGHLRDRRGSIYDRK